MTGTHASIPAELRDRKQWVGHRNKRPVQPNGRPASSTDPATWGTFEQCAAAVESGKVDGVGFVFSEADPYAGIDLDKCRDPETGQIDPEALALVERLASYTEVSQSGRGLHIIVRATLPGTGRNAGGIEIYNKGRYFVMTGHHLDGTPTTIEARQDEVSTLYGELAPAPAAPVARTYASTRQRPDQAAIIERARRYVEKVPGAVSGQRGHDATFKVACRLIEGFGLTVDEARPILQGFNARCSPPWTAHEIEHKLMSAERRADPGKAGHLLDAARPRRTPSVYKAVAS